MTIAGIDAFEVIGYWVLTVGVFIFFYMWYHEEDDE